MKKLILFDWGNVLMDAEFSKYSIYEVNRLVADELGLTDAVIENIVKNDLFWTLGGRALNEFLTQFMPSESVISFKRSWQKYMDQLPWFEEVLGVMDSISTCGEPGVEIGIFSVCSEFDRELIKKKAGKYAKYYFLSYALGLKKPDKHIYPLIETTLDVRGADILYFDDLYQSTQAASRRGWNAVCTDGRNAEFIRERCSMFLNRDLKDNAHFRISTWMSRVYTPAEARPYDQTSIVV